MDPKYHPKIIGRKGAIITNIRTEHDVNIQFPEKNDENQVWGSYILTSTNSPVHLFFVYENIIQKDGARILYPVEFAAVAHRIRLLLQGMSTKPSQHAMPSRLLWMSLKRWSLKTSPWTAGFTLASLEPVARAFARSWMSLRWGCASNTNIRH